MEDKWCVIIVERQICETRWFNNWPDAYIFHKNYPTNGPYNDKRDKIALPPRHIREV